MKTVRMDLMLRADASAQRCDLVTCVREWQIQASLIIIRRHFFPAKFFTRVELIDLSWVNRPIIGGTKNHAWVRSSLWNHEIWYTEAATQNDIIHALLKDKKILTVSFLWKRFRSVFFSRVGTTSRSPYMSSIHRLFCCPYFCLLLWYYLRYSEYLPSCHINK